MDGAIQVRIGNCLLRHFNALFENKESQNRRKKGKTTSEIARESTLLLRHNLGCTQSQEFS
jgi:hypothetical protein